MGKWDIRRRLKNIRGKMGSGNKINNDNNTDKKNKSNNTRNGCGDNNNQNNNNNKENIALVVILVICLILSITSRIGIIDGEAEDNKFMSYRQLLDDIEDNKIEKIVVERGSLELEVHYKQEEKDNETDETDKDSEVGDDSDEVEIEPRIEKVINPNGSNVLEKLAERDIEIEYILNKIDVFDLIRVLVSGAMTLAMLLIVIYIIKTMGTLKKEIGNKADNRDKSKSMVRFEDVAGMTEEKDELKYAIMSLKDIKKYTDKGLRPVRGILLEGPPGVGKTLLAKALAGEYNMNFLYYSGSDFVEMYVGLGAYRIRSMYKKAQSLKPCIVFIDEIDVLGSKRVGGGDGGQRESDQTLVALLERMDGMGTEDGILFIGATNRIEILDKALTRPGRFDKIIHIGLPRNKSDREEIVKVHLKGKELSNDTSIESVAKQCYGLTGAEIASVLNDAVMESFRNNREGVINSKDIDSAMMKLVAKGILKGTHSSEDRNRVAIHEAGHAVMNMLIGRDVIKVSIQPYSSGIGGVTTVDGESAMKNKMRTQTDLINDIKVLYAGKIAEELILGECSIGASNDLERATILIRDYIGAYGMGDNNGNAISLLGLAQENRMITANEKLLERIESKGAEIYTEAKKYMNNDKIISVIKIIAEKLDEKETIMGDSLTEEIELIKSINNDKVGALKDTKI